MASRCRPHRRSSGKAVKARAQALTRRLDRRPWPQCLGAIAGLMFDLGTGLFHGQVVVQPAGDGPRGTRTGRPTLGPDQHRYQDRIGLISINLGLPAMLQDEDSTGRTSTAALSPVPTIGLRAGRKARCEQCGRDAD